MKYADQGNGNHGEDASLDGIEHAEEGEGFGIPGQSTRGVIGAFRFIADRGNEDGNSTELVGPKRVTRLDVTSEPDFVSNEGLSSVAPGSLSPIITGDGVKTMSTSARIAYIMENGEPFCNHCEKNFIPTAISPRIACSTCGCGRPNDDHSIGDENFDHVEGPNAQDLAGKKEIVKQETRLTDTDDYVTAFNKIANDSELYYKGYTDAETGKPLDEDLALLSKDYYNGYEQRKFYHQSPQQSEGQKLFDIKPNSNEIPRQGEMTPEEADRGPLQLTDGTNRATASKVLGLYEGFKTAEYTGTDVSRMSKEQRETGSVCKSPSGLSQAHIDTYGGSATCGKPATGRTDNGAPTCGGSNCGTKVKPLGTISSKISSIFPIDVIQKFFEV